MGDRSVIDWTTSPRVDAYVDLPTGLAPPIVHVTMQKPLTAIGWPVGQIALLGLGVSTVGEMIDEHPRRADRDRYWTLDDVGKAGFVIGSKPPL